MSAIRNDLRSLFIWVLSFGPATFAAPPRYDHIVIVVEENRTLGEIIGDTTNCPYINELASAGVTFASMWSLAHPSQPNYLHLFSGSAQGVTSDDLVVGYPFSTPNLGAELIALGWTFRGYSEGLRAVGDADWDPHSVADPTVKYRRKHNPHANWQAKTTPIPTNQLPAVTNNVFANFPNDFTQLPTVSFVIPDQDHDMHDGSRRQADDWLRANLSAYANWAPSHNSLLVITWDEDDYNEVNRVPTVFYGANLKNGRVSVPTVTLHNLLRTVEDMYGTGHASRATQCRSITGIFETEPTPRLATFCQGLNGYVDARDTFITDEITTSNALSAMLSVDGDYGGGAGDQPSQALLQFNNLFGNGPGQVPANAIVLSAKLIVQTGPGPDDDTADRVAIHRMNVAWSDGDTWNSLNNGIATNDTEARSASTFSANPEVENVPVIFDVTADIEAWKSGTTNNGWVLIPDSTNGTDGWLFASSESASPPSARPTLEISYILPNTPFGYWAEDMNLTGVAAAPLADSDSDDIINLLEFAFRTNPGGSDAPLVGGTGTAGLPIARLVDGPGGPRLELEYVRRKTASGSGLTYAAEFAGEPGQMQPASATPTVTSLDANWERVVVQDTAGIGAPQRFGHVRVTSATSAAGLRATDSRAARRRPR